ncbi:MAG: PEP/pyruvate-binding domain-containing protein [Anaerolineales bacterium]|nr:PEP/pyruvate-binding domain-containing protein [Anaerolineales bacterium]
MNTLPINQTDPALRIHLTLAQYPILQSHIREKMRQAMFDAGVITPKKLQREVRERALKSQRREGLSDPYGEETAEIWEIRLSRIRDYLTDSIFGNNLPFDRFQEIVKRTLSESTPDYQSMPISFNPELAPIEMLFDHALAITRLPPGEAKTQTPRLQEIIVVLIRRIISDHLAYINIAKEWFQIEDLVNIQKRKIGYGKIGGKAAGMLLAYRILQSTADEEIKSGLTIPPSYYLGAGVMYTFMTYNNLLDWNIQKYKPTAEIYADYPRIKAEYVEGEFPPDIAERLTRMLTKFGGKPLIVRSSSLLEDNFGTSFAGKYDSVFCPNQGTIKENYRELSRAIARVYASALNPDALLYRRKQGLLDYDERLAILIQEVQGEKFGKYYLPHTSGVGFSRNLFRWTPKINQEDGFLRLVWGLGTRAVDRMGDDYPRLVALSHPALRPEKSYRDLHHYSQHQVDVINLKKNLLESLPIHKVLTAKYPPLKYLAQVDEGGYLSLIRSTPYGEDPQNFVLTFDTLINKTAFSAQMRDILHILEKHYRGPVDTEFTVHISPAGDLSISLLQCRPQSHSDMEEVLVPDNIPPGDILFNSHRMIPRGKVENIRYILYVSPEDYYSLPTQNDRLALARAIGKVNAALENEVFICIAPGRWGTNNPDLGLRISYSDIYHTRALIELSGKDISMEPDPSFGTHFFQDLVEANIYPLALYLDDPRTQFRQKFFNQAENILRELLPELEEFAGVLHVIDISRQRPGCVVDLIMSDTEEKAVAYFKDIQKS